jgi:hypothetical protein
MSTVTAKLTITLEGGEWDLDRHGWWGPNPPFHAPVFVLGHRPRASVEMEGGTTYTFVTDGIEAAPQEARAAAAELTPVSSRTTPHLTHLVYRRR